MTTLVGTLGLGWEDVKVRNITGNLGMDKEIWTEEILGSGWRAMSSVIEPAGGKWLGGGQRSMGIQVTANDGDLEEVTVFSALETAVGRQNGQPDLGED